MCRIYYSSSVIWISKTKLTCPSGKLRTEFTCSKAKSTSPGLSDTTILARWFAWIFGPKQCPECKNSTFRFLAPIGALPNASPRIAYTSSETQGQSVGPGEQARRKFSIMGGRAPGDAFRRLGTIIQSNFCAQSRASIRLTVWKWSGESRYPGAFPPVLENFRRAFSPGPTDRPWVSEDAGYTAGWKELNWSRVSCLRK